MPLMQRFQNCRLVIHAGDHHPPHCHVLMNDGREALVEIATLRILQGRVARHEIAAALVWAEANSALLLYKFKELQS